MSNWTTPKTWAYKESLASNDMNVYVKENLNYLKDTIDALLPIGIMWIWPTDTAPDGYLLCRGQAISRTTYASLFAIIGTTYGVGDNSTTFNLPNGAGKMFVGKDSTQTEFDTLGETGGDKASTALIAHTHTGPSHTHTGGTGGVSANHTHSGPNHNHSTPTHQHTATTNGESGHTHVPTGSDAFWCYDAGGGETNENLGAGSLTGKKSSTGASSGHTHTLTTDGNQGGGTSGDAGTGQTGTISSDHGHSFTSDAAGTGDTGSAGSGASYSIMNPYQVINYIIKF